MTEQFQRCLAFVAVGSDAVQNGTLPMAETAFSVVLRLAGSLEPEERSLLEPLLDLNQALLRRKQERPEEHRALHDRAVTSLAGHASEMQSPGYCYLVASTFQKLTDYGRAIPYWEQAIALGSETEPIAIASKLHHLGQCFCRVGLPDHAVVPLRAALKLMQHCHEDPHRPALLITLGNALRKREPAESEACYLEAAKWYTDPLQYSEATPAWGNLGILCSEQGRHSEALLSTT